MLLRDVGALKFAPLICQKLNLVAELSITMLRPEAPGSLISQVGDIDNRLKTLFDALTIPLQASQIPADDLPQEGETPFFCLLEDDNLITKVAVSTDRLLEPCVADAIGSAVRDITGQLNAVATVAYTSSGYSALRMARERPQAPVIGMTPRLSTARHLVLVWGVHAVLCHEVTDVSEMSDLASRTVAKEGFGSLGQTIVISAGIPFGTSGTTNMLRIAQIH